jgi:hypothetical protein
MREKCKGVSAKMNTRRSAGHLLLVFRLALSSGCGVNTEYAGIFIDVTPTRRNDVF